MTVNELTRRTRRPLGTVALSALLLLCLTGGGSTGAPAGQAQSLLPEGALAPAEGHRLISKRIKVLLESAHYRRATIDDRMSPQIYERYLDSLDGQRFYLLASDVAEFEQYRLRFDDMINSGNVEPAFLMYARLQQRNRERVEPGQELHAAESSMVRDLQHEVATTREQLDFLVQHGCRRGCRRIVSGFPCRSAAGSSAKPLP